MRGHSLDNPFRCAECGEQLSCAVALRDHQRSHAAPPKTTESLDCGAAPQPRPAAVEGHREGEEEGAHQCGVCDKRFERASHLQQHRYLHTGEKPFTCPDCGKAFAFLQNMKAHWRLHGGEGVSANRLPDADRPLKGLLECPECGKGFRHRSVMEGHMRKHTGERPFQCSLCGKRFKYSSYLQQHLVLHSGSKPFPCPVCGKAFAFNQNMKAHWKLHQEKPHRCPHCHKGYSEEGQLREHLASHAGDKPHLCGLCGKSFGLACQLRDHQDTHSGERPYRCHEGFPWLGSLPVHQKSHESKRQGAAGRARSQKRNRAGGARNQPRPPQVREPGSRGLYGGAFQPQPRRDGAHLFASPEEQAQLLQLLQQQQQLQGAVAPQHRWMEVQQREAVQQLEVNNSAQWQAKMLQQCPRVEAQQLQERATAQQQKQQWQERATEQQSVELQLQERAFGQQQLLGEEQQQQQRMEAQETALEQQCIELRQTEERAGEKRCTQEQREEPQQGGAGEQEEVQEQRGGSPLLKGSEPQPLRPPPAGDGQLQCMECGQAFPREAALHEHYMEHARGDV
ncbi:ZNF83 protein, partial [Polyodon spathula]|nr:ZNF83 protein [Polyodon spathula]